MLGGWARVCDFWWNGLQRGCFTVATTKAVSHRGMVVLQSAPSGVGPPQCIVSVVGSKGGPTHGTYSLWGSLPSEKPHNFPQHFPNRYTTELTWVTKLQGEVNLLAVCKEWITYVRQDLFPLKHFSVKFICCKLPLVMGLLNLIFPFSFVFWVPIFDSIWKLPRDVLNWWRTGAWL